MMEGVIQLFLSGTFFFLLYNGCIAWSINKSFWIRKGETSTIYCPACCHREAWKSRRRTCLSSESGSRAPQDRNNYNNSSQAERRGQKQQQQASLAAASGLTNAEIARYSRHLVLPTVGVSGQVALQRARVLVIGAGGLGSPCLLYLAAAGVGTIGIVDADTVDESNLQRQIIHGTSTVGRSKCESAKERIRDINPLVAVHIFPEEFTSESALRILQATQPWDVVVDGSDNFPTKYLINDACEILGIPWVYSAILGFEGQISVFNYRGGPSYRDLLPSPPDPGVVPSCAEGGVLGVLPGTMGCFQATEVLKIILGKEGVLSGRILVYDALQMKFLDVHIKRNSSRRPVTDLIDYQGFCAGPKLVASGGNTKLDTSAVSPYPVDGTTTNHRVLDEGENQSITQNSLSNDVDAFHKIEPMECMERLLSGWSPWVLDVRLQSEHQIVALPFTDRVVPHRDVNLDSIPQTGPVLIYCKGGVRGKKACRRLIELGVKPNRLYNLEGGILKWQKEVDPNMPRY